MRTVAINGKEYKLAYNLRSLFVYEEIAGHPYTGARSVDHYMLMYAMLMANNTDFAMTFDEFIDECDKDMNLFQTFMEEIEEQGKRASSFLENKKKAKEQ